MTVFDAIINSQPFDETLTIGDAINRADLIHSVTTDEWVYDRTDLTFEDIEEEDEYKLGLIDDVSEALNRFRIRFTHITLGRFQSERSISQPISTITVSFDESYDAVLFLGLIHSNVGDTQDVLNLTYTKTHVDQHETFLRKLLESDDLD